MATGVLDPNEPRDDFKLVHRVNTKLNPPAQRKATTRKTRVPVVVPAPHPIQLGDMVISRDYMSAGSYRKLFAGAGIVRAITTENRRDFNGKAYTVKRMTVIVEGRRVDVLESMLQYAGTPAPEVAPVKLSPLPAKVEIITLDVPLLPDGGEAARREKLARRWNRLACQYKVAQSGAVIRLRALTDSGEALAAAEARQRVRGTSDLPPVDIGKRGQWVKIDGEVVKVRMG
jgi:hypothetical protein